MKPFLTFLVLALGAIGSIDTTVSAGENECINCHGDSNLYVRERNLHNYFQDWLTSPHRKAGLPCDFCHGGDPSASDRKTSHQNILEVSDPKSRLYYKNLPETCGTCHLEKRAEFEQSKHYKALMNDETAPSCTTCHRAMHPKPHYRDIVIQSCRSCHFADNPNGLPLVADRADEYLHRLSIAKVYLGWVYNYYENLGWQGNSRSKAGEIGDHLEAAITRVHRFDLESMDESSAEILAEAEALFKQLWAEKDNTR